ncbi:MAG: hypothetical protein JKY62_06020 [Desulfocapsa sp.]|nr:hypothetical protein [Desulfocapsa sp.]
MKNTNKLILGAIVLLLSTGVALSSASANAPAVTEAAKEVVTQTTGDMAKEAAGEVVDSAKEKAIGIAKEQADTAVDAGVEKVTEALSPADAVKKAAE